MQNEKDKKQDVLDEMDDALDAQMQKYLESNGDEKTLSDDRLIADLQEQLGEEAPVLNQQMYKYIENAEDQHRSTEENAESKAQEESSTNAVSTAQAGDVFSQERPEKFWPRLRYDMQHRLKPYFTENNHKQTKRWAIFGSIAAVVVVLAVVALVMGSKLSSMNSGVTGDPNITASPEDDLHIDDYYQITDADSLNEMLYTWQNNKGQLLSSKNVVNILLVGVDSATGEMSGGRSDVIMIASLNKRTQKITLLSVLRDCYVYMNINGSERYDKLNHSFMWAGPEGLQAVLESLYKFKIDHYACVDFTTFPKLIDALGGVTVPVTQEESDFLNRKYHQSISAGDDVKLNGSEALLFCRIRKLSGGDDQRARRQRDLIESLIKRSEEAGVAQLGNAVQVLLPNIRTNMNTAKIISLGTEGITNKWMQYDRTKMTSPTEESRKGTLLYTYSSQFLNNKKLSVWVVDFPSEARAVQLALYGQTNIPIPENYTSPLELLTPTEKANTGTYTPPSASYSTSTTTHTAAGTTNSLPSVGESSTQPTVNSSEPISNTQPPVSQTEPPQITTTQPETTLPPVTQEESNTQMNENP